MVIDHYSRRIMGMTIFKHNPTSLSVQRFLKRAIDDARVTPKDIISDKGQRFWCDLFKGRCNRRGITPRFGAVGQHGSIAVVERIILRLKKETSISAALFHKKPKGVGATRGTKKALCNGAYSSRI